VAAPGFSPAGRRRSPGDFFRSVPQGLFPAPGKAQKIADGEILRQQLNKKKTDMVYGGTPDHLFPRRILSKVVQLSTLQLDFCRSA
jgi:hypothetical protein